MILFGKHLYFTTLLYYINISTSLHDPRDLNVTYKTTQDITNILP